MSPKIVRKLSKFSSQKIILLKKKNKSIIVRERRVWIHVCASRNPNVCMIT